MAIVRWLFFSALTLLLGAGAVRWLVVGRVAHFPWRERAHRILAAAGAVSGFVAWLALAGLFTAQLLQFRDPFAPLGEEASLLLGTAWGRAWSAAFAMSSALPLAFLAAFRGSRELRTGAWTLATLLSLGLAFFPAFSGHAVASERALIAVVADGLHVVSAGSWFGSLGMILILDAHARTGFAPVAGVLAALLPRFSPLALASAAILLGSGLYATWLHVPGPASLLSSRYGRLLLGKLLLVAGVVGLGAFHWRRSLPRLVSRGEAAELRRTATVEWLMAQVVLAVTAVLVASSPPLEGP